MAETETQELRQIIRERNQQLTREEVIELSKRGLLNAEIDILVEERRFREPTTDEKLNIIMMLNAGVRSGRVASFWDLDPKWFRKLRKQWGLLA
jgi:hypothetical protein